MLSDLTQGRNCSLEMGTEVRASLPNKSWRGWHLEAQEKRKRAGKREMGETQTGDKMTLHTLCPLLCTGHRQPGLSLGRHRECSPEKWNQRLETPGRMPRVYILPPLSHSV